MNFPGGIRKKIISTPDETNGTDSQYKKASESQILRGQTLNSSPRNNTI